MRLLLFLLLLGCTSTGQSTKAKPRAILTGGSGVILASPVELAPTDSVQAAPDAVMRALLGAYEAMGFTVSLLDPVKRRLGNPGFVVRRAIAGVPMHEFLRCGETFSGQRADDDRITMSLITAVTPTDGGGSRMETRLEATATDVRTGNSGDHLPCTSSGMLETRIHQNAKIRLAK